jgi:hypothetical protein
MATERKFNRYPDGFEITDKRGQDENYDDTRDHEFLLDEENLIELAMLIETWKEKYATPS